GTGEVPRRDYGPPGSRLRGSRQNARVGRPRAGLSSHDRRRKPV
ncbi:MAG: hypothetical protein AVDCRST_MAG78-1866, partial [uncultured Rubrobacteraceae bacterium]